MSVNADRNPRQAAPFTADDVAAIRRRLTTKGEVRNLALLECAISTALRVSDLLGLRVSDVTDEGAVATSAHIRQGKTGNVVRVALTKPCQAALQAHITHAKLSGANYLFTSHAPGAKPLPLSRKSFHLIVKRWADIAGRDPDAFSAHSTRRTLASHVWRTTHDLAAARLVLGHSSLAATADYLGVAAEDAVQLVHDVAI